MLMEREAVIMALVESYSNTLDDMSDAELAEHFVILHGMPCVIEPDEIHAETRFGDVQSLQRG